MTRLRLVQRLEPERRLELDSQRFPRQARAQKWAVFWVVVAAALLYALCASLAQ